MTEPVRTYTVQDPFTDAVLIGFELPPPSHRAVEAAAAAQGITVEQLLRDIVDARFKEWHEIVQRVGLEGARALYEAQKANREAKPPVWLARRAILEGEPPDYE
jgi:hypothetical protein